MSGNLKAIKIDFLLVNYFCPPALGGILEQLAGFIFASCSDCDREEDDEPTLTLRQVFSDLIAPLGIPAWYGSAIGHVRHNFTVPLGVEVEVDAERGTILMLEPAVL